MKKMISSFLAISLAVGCTACSGAGKSPSGASAAETEEITKQEQETEKETASDSGQAKAKTYKAGTYTGVGTGMDGEVQVMVTFSDDAITDIRIGQQNETAGICETVYEQIPAEILAHQSLAVDSVSGATITSAAVKRAVEHAAAQAGADIDALKAAEVPSKAEDGEYEYDVVVAGAGLSGLMAAYRAADAGAKVALIEKTGILGGTSITASGIFACAESEEYVEPMYEAWLKKNENHENNQVEDNMVRSLCQSSPEVVGLLKKAGVKYEISTSESNQSQTFFSSANEASERNAQSIKLASKDASAKGGAQLIHALEEACVQAGVAIYRNTPGTRLLISDDGSVTGIVSETPKYGTKTFHAKAVVLATGDYAKNAEMTAQINPKAAGEYSATAVGNTGDGITMALEAGGVLDEFQESMSGVFNANPFDMPTIGDRTNPYPFESVVLTMDGRRVFKEDGGSHQQMVYFVRDTELDTAWCVMDQEIAGKFVRLDEYLKNTENGHPLIKAYKEDSLDALAEDMEIPVETLKAVIEQYNNLCENGEDTDCGKDPRYLSAIDDDTYYGVLMYDGTRGNYGGIVTSTDGAVVDKDGNNIPGLYAGGIISSGAFFADYYPGGQALAVASHMGFKAGESAAEYAGYGSTKE